MLKPFGYFDMLEHFAEPGCVVCNLLVRDVRKQLDSLLYEYAADTEMLDFFRASRGMCNQHSWQLIERGNILGITVLYQASMHEVLKVMRQATSGGTGANFARRLFSHGNNTALVDALEPTQPCVACKTATKGELLYIQTLSKHLHEDKMQAAYRTSEGLCLEHFRQALRHTSDAKSTQFLVNTQRDIWERLHQELLDLIHKYDFSHVDEKIESEGDSWRRALARLVGEKGVFGIRRPKS